MCYVIVLCCVVCFDYIRWCGSLSYFFFQAEDGIRYLVRSRGLGDVYKRQGIYIRTVRNNLFHGGKFVGSYEPDISRNYTLINNLSLIHI